MLCFFPPGENADEDEEEDDEEDEERVNAFVQFDRRRDETMTYRERGDRGRDKEMGIGGSTSDGACGGASAGGGGSGSTRVLLSASADCTIKVKENRHRTSETPI